MQKQLLLEREVHGTVQLSQIELERLLDELVGAELSRRKEHGLYRGTYTAVCHYFGYQARSALPSLFDANLGYTLGMTAAALLAVDGGISGSVAIARGLINPVAEWSVGAIPVTSLLSVMPRKAAAGGLRAVSAWRVAPQVRKAAKHCTMSAHAADRLLRRTAGCGAVRSPLPGGGKQARVVGASGLVPQSGIDAVRWGLG